MRRTFFLHLGEIKPCDDLFLSSKEKLTHGIDDALEAAPILYYTQETTTAILPIFFH